MTKQHGLEQSIYIHNILLLLSRAVIDGEQNWAAKPTTMFLSVQPPVQRQLVRQFRKRNRGRRLRPSGNDKRLQQFHEPFRPSDSLLTKCITPWPNEAQSEPGRLAALTAEVICLTLRQ